MKTERRNIEIRLELPRDMYSVESRAKSEDYALGEPESLPPDPDAMEAGFIEPVTAIAALTVAVLAERLLHFALAKRGYGVLVDARDKPPNVSVLKGVPQGFIVIIRPDGTTEKVRADDPGTDLTNLLGKALK
jgi:hypothetical protein